VTHTAMVAANDGETRMWIDGQHRFAKLVRDGKTLARIDRYSDGTFATYADGVRTHVATWEIAAAWLTSRACSEALVSALWIPVRTCTVLEEGAR